MGKRKDNLGKTRTRPEAIGEWLAARRRGLGFARGETGDAPGKSGPARHAGLTAC